MFFSGELEVPGFSVRYWYVCDGTRPSSRLPRAVGLAESVQANSILTEQRRGTTSIRLSKFQQHFNIFLHLHIPIYSNLFAVLLGEELQHTVHKRHERERERNWVMWKIRKTFPFDSDLFWIVLPFLSRLSLCSMFKFDVLMCTSTHSLSQACLSCG